MKHIKLFEQFVNESEEYAVVLTGGSIGDKPRPRNAKGYEGMDAGKEDLYSLDKAKEKAKRMNTQVLTPGERSHYGLKYIVVPVKGGKFIAESTELNEKIDLKLSTNEYPSGSVARYRLESDTINLRKVANLASESWSKSARAFTDNELGFESASDRKTAMAAIQKSFDNGHNDMREYVLESLGLGVTINEAADLKSVSDIIKREERWSDRDFSIEILKDGVILVAPKHSRQLRKSLDLLGAHFDIKSRSESIDDDRLDFWEYFLKPKGVKSKDWDGLDVNEGRDKTAMSYKMNNSDQRNVEVLWSKLKADKSKSRGDIIDVISKELGINWFEISAWLERNGLK
jgi:hypothetical protein